MELFKTATAQNVRSLLVSAVKWPAGQGLPLPSGYESKQKDNLSYLQKTYVYHDFKQAFCHMTLIAKTCHQLGYAPTMFNVYNRIVLKLSTTNQKGSEVTGKDVYMAHLLDEIHSKTADQAHQSVLGKIRHLL